jgi:nicotinic acid phosphoribosyltransferase
MTDLKPCPFCGETEFLVAYNRPLKVAKGGGRVLQDQYQVRCKNNTVHAEVTMEVSSSGTAEHALAAWSRLVVDPAAIREAALREAAAVAEALSVKWWREYKDRLSPHCADPHYQGMSDGADDVAAAILELIGEKK